MREIRTSGSEGGGVETNRCSLPLSSAKHQADGSPPYNGHVVRRKKSAPDPRRIRNFVAQIYKCNLRTQPKVKEASKPEDSSQRTQRRRSKARQLFVIMDEFPCSENLCSCARNRPKVVRLQRKWSCFTTLPHPANVKIRPWGQQTGKPAE